MVFWISLGAVLLSLIFLALVVRALLVRLAGLKAAQAGLQQTAERAQELATVAQGLQAHTEPVRRRLDLLQERMAAVKGHRVKSADHG